MTRSSDASGDPGTSLPSPGPDAFEDAAIGMAFVSRDGRLLRVNPELCDLLGRDKEKLLATPWADLTCPDELSSSHGQLAELLAGRRGRVDSSQRFLRPDGEVVVARVTTEMATVNGERAVFTQLHDATEETAALAAMCESERRFRAFIDCSADAFFWLRVRPDTRIRFVSGSAAEMSGYGVQEFYDDAALWHRLVHPEDRHLLEFSTTGQSAAVGGLVRWVRRDNSILWVEQRMSRLVDVDGTTDILCVARDATDRVEADGVRVRREARQRAVTTLAQLSLTAHDPSGVLHAATTAASRLLAADAVAVWWEVEAGGEFRLVAGTGFTDLEPGSSVVDATTSHASRVRANHAPTSHESTFSTRDMTYGAELVRDGVTCGIGVPVRSNGRIMGALAAYFREIHVLGPDEVTFLEAMAATLGAYADRARFDEELGYQLQHDPLTGLPNRALLVDHLTRQLQAAGPGELVSVALCDVDDFKLLNEAIGHDAGDQLLRSVAERLKVVARDAMVARAGGDQFAIIVQAPAGDPIGERVVHDAIAAMTAPFTVGSREITATISVGLAAGSSTGTANAVLASALAAVDLAKRRGRGRWVLASGQEQTDALRRLEIANDLRDAIRSGGILAHFQSIVSLQTGETIGFEALARWQLPDGTVVAPTEFIPIAEDTGLIREIGLSMLDQACSFLETMHTNGAEQLMMTVNVSPRQLDNPAFAEHVEEVLARYAIPRTAIFLELTESALVPGDQEMVERLDALKRLGISLAIDDFGTGYSSFAYLTQFPIDLLKLDRAFVTDLHVEARRLVVLRSIISLARTLGIAVLAEGIQTAGERDILTSLDCELGQGFLWSLPVPADEAMSALSDPARTASGDNEQECVAGCG